MKDDHQDHLEAIMGDISNRTGVTSTEAAALILSDGRTDNPVEAGILASGQTLELEELERAALRRMMGFDFVIKIRDPRIMVISKEGPHLIKKCVIKPGEIDEYGNIISESLIKRLTQACVRLKLAWDAEVMRQEAKRKRSGR